ADQALVHHAPCGPEVFAGGIERVRPPELRRLLADRPAADRLTPAAGRGSAGIAAATGDRYQGERYPQSGSRKSFATDHRLHSLLSVAPNLFRPCIRDWATSWFRPQSSLPRAVSAQRAGRGNP